MLFKAGGSSGWGEGKNFLSKQTAEAYIGPKSKFFPKMLPVLFSLILRRHYLLYTPFLPLFLPISNLFYH
jgi:hypothetical protein